MHSNPYQDLAGNPGNPASDHELQTYADALEDFHGFRSDPATTMAQLLDEHPGFTMGWVLHAWLYALSTEPTAIDTVRNDLARAGETNPGPRETAHLAAIQDFVNGNWTLAAQALQSINNQWPRDALALQAGHIIDFLRGDARTLRDRIATALPHWAPADRGYAELLGMLAFGHEENGEYALAEQTAKASLELSPYNTWAHHAQVHVLEMQGRTREGIAWITDRMPFWADDSFLAIHNHWHLALLHLDTGDIDATLNVLDQGVLGSNSTLVVDLVDASAMLARLALLGVPVGNRWEAVADAWTIGARAGHYVFNDFHAMLGWLGSGREDEAQQYLSAQCGPRGQTASEQAELALSLGAPLLQALKTAADGKPKQALELLCRIEPFIHRMGGSHAQRDLLDLIAIDLALRAGETDGARRRISQRLQKKPQSFINHRLDERLAARSSPQSAKAERSVSFAG